MGVDLSIYDTNRLWRIPDTRHAGSGLYKVGLTVDEFLTATGDKIRALARSPRPEVRPVPWGDQAAIATLAELFAAPPSGGGERGRQEGDQVGGEASHGPRKDGPASNSERARLRPLFDAIRAKGADAGQGGHRHSAALFIGYFLREDGWPLQTAFEMARSINNTRFRPPIDDAQLKHQIEDAFARGWLLSAEHLAALKEAFLVDEKPDPFDPSRLAIYELGNPDHLNLPLPSQIVEQHIVAGGNNAIGGLGKLGKSLYSADLAYHTATGRLFLGRYQVEQRPVLYITNEDHPALLASRFRRVIGGGATSGVPLRWVAPPGLDLCDPRWTDFIVKYARGGVAFVDVLAKSLGKRNENETRDMNEVAISLHMLREAGVTPFLVHHLGKPRGDDRDSGQQRPSSESWRGSSVIFNCLDIAIQMIDHGRDKEGRKLRRLYSWTKVAPDGLDVIIALNPSPTGPLFEYLGEFDPDQGKGARIDRLYEAMPSGVPISAQEGAWLLNNEVKPETVTKYLNSLAFRKLIEKTGKTKDARWTKPAARIPV